jgi:hypothetical protein
MPIRDWGIILNQFSIIFNERLGIYYPNRFTLFTGSDFTKQYLPNK